MSANSEPWEDLRSEPMADLPRLNKYLLIIEDGQHSGVNNFLFVIQFPIRTSPRGKGWAAATTLKRQMRIKQEQCH